MYIILRESLLHYYFLNLLFILTLENNNSIQTLFAGALKNFFNKSTGEGKFFLLNSRCLNTFFVFQLFTILINKNDDCKIFSLNFFHSIKICLRKRNNLKKKHNYFYNNIISLRFIFSLKCEKKK